MKNEKVLCVPVSQLQKRFDLLLQAWRVSISEMNLLETIFIDRTVAETDFSLKQLIPYAVLFNDDGELFTYRRRGSEKRLSGIQSIGIGGHVNDKDFGDTVFDKLVKGMIREIKEEIGLALSQKQIQLLGMINEDETEVGFCHIGIVFKIQLTNETLSFDSEIADANWANPKNLELSNFELWSRLALKLIQDHN